jgi:CubicO group peptidase (beta-lactamase class C family)
MKKLITFVFVSIFIISSVQSQNEYAAAESALQQLTKNETVIGVSGAISVNGKTVFKTSFGYADEKSKTPFTAVTLSRTASIAKSMTAIAVLQLFEKGIIDLDAPIQT